VNLVELTGAYASFANNGTKVLPYIVVRIRDGQGRIIYERNSDMTRRVITKKHVAFMNEMLNAVVTSGTGQQATLENRPVAGKTGTSNGYRDAWFVGYTADYIAGVWVGNDKPTPMKEVTGGGLPTAIWHDIMEKAHRKQPIRPLPGIYAK
jgi:penicillin-binding protein 1A